MSDEVIGLKKWDYPAKCDSCQRRVWASTMQVRWDNAFVCKLCWEPRHEQDQIPTIPEHRTTPIARAYTVLGGTISNLTVTAETDTENWYGNGDIEL